MFKYVVSIPLIASILIGCIIISKGNLYAGLALIVLGSFLLGTWTVIIVKGWDK